MEQLDFIKLSVQELKNPYESSKTTLPSVGFMRTNVAQSLIDAHNCKILNNNPKNDLHSNSNNNNSINNSDMNFSYNSNNNINCMLLLYHVCVSERIYTHSYLNVKERLARHRRDIWSLSDSNGIRTHNHLVQKRTLNHSHKLAFFG